MIAALVLAPVAWYGPATVTASVPYSGDPYDPADNDVHVVFTPKSGPTLDRLAYFVGEGRFAATLVAPAPGTYTASFVRNGEVVVKGIAVPVQTKLAHGFIGRSGMRFAWSDGTPYFPLGYDYAWRLGQGETVAQGIAKLGASGGNWSRIWACHWDGKNPYFPAKREEKLPGRELSQGPLKTWDEVVAAAEAANVSFQMTLFHHGPYSSTTDSNWREHPWNAANGGFLKNPTDFFTDAEAKRRSKIWLRYAVARYAHSPAIMAWELFNEVQWTNGFKERPADVAAWHREMGDYVRSLDPYHHLVTSSSNEAGHPEVFASMDFDQPHTYPSNVLAAIGGARFTGKPGFFGEFGPPGGRGTKYREAVRDGIYGGMLAGHAGAGMFWFWDQIDRSGLAADYKVARRVIDGSGLLSHTSAKPVSLAVVTPHLGDATLSPGRGWEKSTTTSISLPTTDLSALGGWSRYFQSQEGGHRDWAAPFTLKFVAKAPGAVRVDFGDASSGGADVTIWVNEKVAFQKKWAADERTHPTATLDVPTGPVVVRMENHGPDWVQISAVHVPGMAPSAMAHGMSDGRWALLRIVGSDASDVRVSGLTLRDGGYPAKVYDLLTGKIETRKIAVKGGTFAQRALPNECVIAIGK